jgi:hypothetical protein
MFTPTRDEITKISQTVTSSHKTITKTPPNWISQGGKGEMIVKLWMTRGEDFRLVER